MDVSDKSMTLRAQEHGHQPIVCFEPMSMKEENWQESTVKNALRSNASRSSHAICYPAAFMGGQGAKARTIAYCDDGSTPTLKSVMSGGNTVPDVVYPASLKDGERDA